MGKLRDMIKWIPAGLAGLGLASAVALVSLRLQIPARLADYFTESSLEKEIEKKWNINIIGTSNEKELKRLKDILDNCEKGRDNFVNQMSYLRAINLTAWNPYKADGSAYTAVRGIELDTISDGTLIHELAHIYHKKHPQEKELNKEWEKAAKYSDIERRSLYEIDEGKKKLSGPLGGQQWKDTSKDRMLDGPKHGFINAYGAQNTSEDIATFCGNVNAKLGMIARMGKLPADWNIAKGDPRYLAKLDLLKKYGFISEKEYEIVKPNFAP